MADITVHTIDNFLRIEMTFSSEDHVSVTYADYCIGTAFLPTLEAANI